MLNKAWTQAISSTPTTDPANELWITSDTTPCVLPGAASSFQRRVADVSAGLLQVPKMASSEKSTIAASKAIRAESVWRRRSSASRWLTVFSQRTSKQFAAVSGYAPVEALGEVAAEVPQDCELHFGLDPLGERS